MKSPIKIHRIKLVLLISIVIILVLGFYTKFYPGPAKNWVNNSLGGFFYTMFFCFVFVFFFPNKPFRVCLWVFTITSFIEFTQLLHFPFLEFIREYFIGRALIGSTFNGSDFLYYFLGAAISYLLLRFFERQYNR